MAQNVTIAGASYLGVPRIEMPKTGGGTAVFVDTSDANAAAGDITKGKTAYVGGTKITGTLEASSSGGAKETWVIKSNAGGELVTTQISFTSNGQKFTSIGANGYSGTFVILYYDNNEVAGYDPGIGGVYEFDNEAYRKLTFDTPPTGALLTWLQANGVKQPDDTAVQDTKALTITSNGTVSVTPDAPYDALKKVDVTVNVASGGGGGTTPSAKWDDVTFIDYDGAVLYSYSLAEAQALTDLPTLPSHDGLVCQGWNWTLEAIKSLNRPVAVGAMYITDDGATRLHIKIATVGRMTVPLYIGQTVANGVYIDWGDGSTTQTLSGTGNVNTSHTYAEPGDYVISLMPQDGCTLSFGDGSSSYCVMGSTGSNGRVYCNMLQDVSIGKNVTSIINYAFQNCNSLASITIPDGVTSISNYAFCYCYSLANITIPDGVTSIGNYAFRNCNSLASITIPDGVTSIGDNAFYSCYSLASITIPDGVTSIGNYAFRNCESLASITIPNGVTSISNNVFYNCYSLANITIPNGVTSIGNYAFYNCYGMRYYDFSACTAIPALSNKNAFNNIPSDCQMLIPSTLFNNWKSATNWATYASKMVSV